MKTKNIAKFKEGKAVQKVTKLPNFVLRLKGKAASKKPTAVDAYLNRLCMRCAAIENNECVTAEEILHAPRLDASKILASIGNNQQFIKIAPEIREEVSAIDIRQNIRNQAAKNSALGNLKELGGQLCSINETIINTDSCLEQRIQKTRHLCSEKIDAYIFGVRKGGEADYQFDLDYTDSPLNAYYEKHRAGDDTIKVLVEKLYKSVNGKED